jgi:predicted amidohydrolase
VADDTGGAGRASCLALHYSAMLAVVQFRPRRGARNANLEKLVALTTQALQAGAKLVVLPEMAATGYRFPNPDVVRPMSELPRGPTFKAFATLAKEHAAHIVVGFVEDNEGKLYNAALVISPEGKLEALYRKRLLYIDDHTWANPGDLPYPVFDTAWGKTTVGICMDINDPRFLTHVRKVRPDMVLFPTNWVDENVDVHRYWMNQLRGWNGILVAADRWGDEDGVFFAGRSAIFKAGKTLVEGPPEGDGFYLAEVPVKPAAAPKPAPVVEPGE